MSEHSVTVCDACGKVAPAEYSPFFPGRTGWIHLQRGHLGEWDSCSPDCAAKVVYDLGGRHERGTIATEGVKLAKVQTMRGTSSARPTKRAGSA